MLLPVLLAVAFLSGCQSLRYYSHAALGELRLLASREPVPRVLNQLEPKLETSTHDALLYQRLEFTQRVLDFAKDTLKLPVDDRYRTYVSLNRSAVVWNLFAAPPLSLTPRRWCYPIVGCAPYRGYFNERYAKRRAAALHRQGLETYLGPVPAYSTLGWFADPLLSTFITWPEPDLASLLFHELAHGRVWAKGDVAFNESFATFVGRQGLSAWLRRQGEAEVDRRYEAALEEQQSLLDLLKRTRRALAAVYRSDAPEAVKLAQKARVVEATKTCYARHRERLGGGRFDDMMTDLNNAHLVSLATYEDLVPAFADLFHSVGGNWSEFYRRVDALAKLDHDERRAALRRAALLSSVHQQVGQHGDHRRAEEVQCQSLPGHLLDAEPAGGVHDDVGRGGDRQHEGAGRAHGGRDHEQLRVHAGTESAGRQDGHEQRRGGGVAGGLGEEGDGQTDDENDHEHGQAGQPRESVADGLAESRMT